jgi:hypothetical protein
MKFKHGDSYIFHFKESFSNTIWYRKRKEQEKTGGREGRFSFGGLEIYQIERRESRVIFRVRSFSRKSRALSGKSRAFLEKALLFLSWSSFSRLKKK